jgi:hypothetical protein
MPDQLPLLSVPGYHRELTIKADLNGITILKEGRFRKRYTGSKQFAVDINGKLHKAAALKEIIDQSNTEKFGTKKRQPARTANEKETDMPDKDTKKKYTVNKPEIRQRIFSMVASQPDQQKELYFWTVTFPIQTTDITIYRLFNTWLTRLRQLKLLKNYLWVAERQQNGTLHFHIAIPHKMPVKTANKLMATCLITAAKNKEINYSVYQCKRYNGVDIAKNRKLRKVTNFALGRKGARALTNYITKYITKNKGEFEHLAWHNSRGFSMLFTGITFTVAEFTDILKLVGAIRPWSAVNNDFFQWHPWQSGSPPDCIYKELKRLNSHIQNLN